MAKANFFADLETLGENSTHAEVEMVKVKYMGHVKYAMKRLQFVDENKAIECLEDVKTVMEKVWRVSVHGNDLGTTISNLVRNSDGIKLLAENLKQENLIYFATVLELFMTKDICQFIVDSELDQPILNGIKSLIKGENVGVAFKIVQHLSKYSENLCHGIIDSGWLDAALLDVVTCSDVQTLRSLATVLTNFAIFGSSDHKTYMLEEEVLKKLSEDLIKKNDDPIVKYFSFLAIAILTANKDVEENVFHEVDGFLKSLPSDFSDTLIAHERVQCKEWLSKLVPFLSNRHEGVSCLIAFHLWMEAKIQKKLNDPDIFWEIKAVDELKSVSTEMENAASVFSDKALKVLCEKVKLWSVNDVSKWVSDNGFSEYARKFEDLEVNGHELLSIDDTDLIQDIEMNQRINRKRFMRKREILVLMEALNGNVNTCKKHYDIFISYRRLGGKFIASLLKVQLEKLNYSVFLDVENLQLGKFPEQLENAIRNAKHFVLILTDTTLDRCFNKGDWIRREIMLAKESKCNIIPLLVDCTECPFKKMPEDISFISEYQSMTWEHTNQKGTMLKLENYLR